MATKITSSSKKGSKVSKGNRSNRLSILLILCDVYEVVDSRLTLEKGPVFLSFGDTERRIGEEVLGIQCGILKCILG